MKDLLVHHAPTFTAGNVDPVDSRRDPRSDLLPLSAAGRTGRWKTKMLMTIGETLQALGVLYSAAPEAPYPLGQVQLLDPLASGIAAGVEGQVFLSSKSRTVFSTAGGFSTADAARDGSVPSSSGLRFRGVTHAPS